MAAASGTVDYEGRAGVWGERAEDMRGVGDEVYGWALGTTGLKRRRPQVANSNGRIMTIGGLTKQR